MGIVPLSWDWGNEILSACTALSTVSSIGNVLHTWEFFSLMRYLAGNDWCWHRHPGTGTLAHFYLMAANIMPGGRLIQWIKSWSLLKSKSSWLTLLVKSFDTLSTLRWFPMVWIPSAQDRTQSSHVSHFPSPPWCSHVTQVLLIRCTYRAVDTEMIYVRKQVGCRASVLQAQMVGRGSVVLESSGAENSFPASSARRFWGLFLEAHFRACSFSSPKDCEYSKSLLNYFLL